MPPNIKIWYKESEEFKAVQRDYKEYFEKLKEFAEYYTWDLKQR